MTTAKRGPASYGVQSMGKSHACTPAGARLLPIHEQLLKMASKATGVDCPEASVALTICRKTASQRLSELVDEGLVVRAVGGWQGRRVRWFKHQAHAAIFTEGARKVMAPKEVERRARIASQLRAPGIVHTVAPLAPDHRFTVDPTIRGPFSSAGVGRYVDPPSGWVAAMGVR